MSSDQNSAGFDVAVIGGGLAGVTAARDLADQGHSVVLLEARDRLGGRVYPGTFGDTGHRIELGGTYVSSLNRFVKRELDRYGIPFETAPAPENFAHLLGGKRYETRIPIPPEEVLDFERVAFATLEKASRLDVNRPLDDQIHADLNVSWQEHISALDPSPGVRDLFESWGEVESGRPASEFSALLPFWVVAQLGNSLAAFELTLEGKISGGPSAVIEAMLAGVEVDLRLATPVASVEQEGERVRITTVEGDAVSARAGVLAVPVNCWDEIAFEPGLSSAKLRAAKLRGGTPCLKGWALVEDAPPRLVGHAAKDAAEGTVLIMNDGEIDGAQLVTLFNLYGDASGSGPQFDVNDAAQVERVLQKFAPGCRLLACEGHDWNSDPYAKGSYASYPIEMFDLLPELRQPEGRFAFAGADIAEGFTMWMDGAFESGSTAAGQVDRILGGVPAIGR